jgi:hypothetical protein
LTKTTPNDLEELTAYIERRRDIFRDPVEAYIESEQKTFGLKRDDAITQLLAKMKSMRVL